MCKRNHSQFCVISKLNFVPSPMSHPPTQNVYRHDSEAAKGKPLEIGNNIFHAAFLIFVISNIKRDEKFQVEHIGK